MPSERKIPPTTRRIKTTAFVALLRIIFIGEFVFSYRPHFQPKVTKFTADAKARKEGNIEQPPSNAQCPMEQALGAVIGCSILVVGSFLSASPRLGVLAFENYLTADASDH